MTVQSRLLTVDGIRLRQIPDIVVSNSTARSSYGNPEDEVWRRFR